MAIIESLSLDLNEKMTVLTGETGAGKSIIIDSISLLLGERASTEVIRHNEDKAIIEAVFSVPIKAELQQFLEDNDIDYDADESLIIKRTIKRTGGSQVRLNGSIITVNQLKELGGMLVDIHVQHDSFRLFQPEMYYGLLDNLVKTDKIVRLRQSYLDTLADYRVALSAYKDFKAKSEDVEDRLFQLNGEKEELAVAKLVIGEIEELNRQRDLMASSDELHSIFSDVLQATNGDDAAMELLHPVLEQVEDLVKINSKFEPLLEQIRDVYYNLEDFIGTITREKGKLTYDPRELEQVEERISDLRRLERKYKMDIAELIEYEKQITLELAGLENVDEYEEDLINEIKDYHKLLIERGEALNDARVTIANKVKTALVKELQDLKLPHAQFDVLFTRVVTDDAMYGNYSSNGLYEIDLLLSTNKGEPLKPLNKVASGGELSRIMLALKSILNRGQLIGTIIFDEIDIGVSGQVATSIGAKMQEISSYKQVLCITHLPQVASFAHHHLQVRKVDDEGRTTTQVHYLEGTSRVHEIAVMMSDETVTEASLRNAKEMLVSKGSNEFHLNE
jgi:DNA repair protein RecN (Recombination protein N)